MKKFKSRNSYAATGMGDFGQDDSYDDYDSTLPEDTGYADYEEESGSDDSSTFWSDLWSGVQEAAPDVLKAAQILATQQGKPVPQTLAQLNAQYAAAGIRPPVSLMDPFKAKYGVSKTVVMIGAGVFTVALAALLLWPKKQVPHA